jgi:hypothetical protein
MQIEEIDFINDESAGGVCILYIYIYIYRFWFQLVQFLDPNLIGSYKTQ